MPRLEDVEKVCIRSWSEAVSRWRYLGPFSLSDGFRDSEAGSAGTGPQGRTPGRDPPTQSVLIFIRTIRQLSRGARRLVRDGEGVSPQEPACCVHAVGVLDDAFVSSSGGAEQLDHGFA